LDKIKKKKKKLLKEVWKEEVRKKRSSRLLEEVEEKLKLQFLVGTEKITFESLFYTISVPVLLLFSTEKTEKTSAGGLTTCCTSLRAV